MNIEKEIKKTIKKYNITNKKEKILVALSGGKDSALTAYTLKKLGYNIEGIHINLGIKKYSENCLKKIKELCNQLEIKLHIYDIKKEMGKSICHIRELVQFTQKEKINNCAICGVAKKWILNREARKLKFDKIATGHNLDDEAQTFLLNILKGSPKLSATSGPITKNKENTKFVPRIKPLFYIPENKIRKYVKQKKIPIHPEPCPCSSDSYRIQIRKFLNTLTTKDKRNIINNLDILNEKIQNTKDIKKILYCKICGEPSKNKICKRCQFIKNK